MYKITVNVNQEWLDILGVISRHQDGFVWVDVQGLTEQV